MQCLKLHWHYLRMSWVLAKSQCPCSSKKQIRIVKLNYSDTVIDGGNTKREKCIRVHNICKDWKTVFEAKLSVFEDKNTVACRDIFSHGASMLGSWRLVFQGVKSRTVCSRGLRLEAGFVLGKAGRTAAVLLADSSDTPCITSQWSISYT